MLLSSWSSSSVIGTVTNASSSPQATQDIFMPAYSLMDCGDPVTRDAYKCASSAVLDTLCIATLVFVVVQVVLLIRRSKLFWSYKHFLMYTCVIELILAIVHYSFVRDSYVFCTVILFLELCQYLTIAYHFSLYSLRVSGHPQWEKRILIPGVFAFGIVLLAMLVVELCDKSVYDFDFDRCLNISWVLFTIMQLVLGVIFIITGSYLTKPRRTVLIGKEFAAKRRSVLTFVILYTFCSVFVLGIQIVMVSAFKSMGSCANYLDNNDLLNMFFLISLFLLDMYIPMWSMIVVFYYLTSKRVSLTNSSRQIDRNAILPEEKTLMRYTVSFLPNNDSGGSNGSAGSFGSFGNYDTVN